MHRDHRLILVDQSDSVRYSAELFDYFVAVPIVDMESVLNF